MAGAAKTMDEPEVEAEAAPVAAKPKARSKLGLIIGAVVVLLAAGAGGFFMMSHKSAADPHAAAAEGHEGGEAHEGAAAAKSGSANYEALSPQFVVNLEDEEASRYLQIEVQVMARDSHVIDDVKLHSPRIRNALLLLFGQQHYKDISSREGKEALQAKVLAEVQHIMTQETGKPGVEAVYFTSFVMQ